MMAIMPLNSVTNLSGDVAKIRRYILKVTPIWGMMGWFMPIIV